ncbi:MAG: IS1634 family transposase [Promethearchaeota archaeon]
MVYLTRKKKKNKYYLYLEESAWVDGKSKRLWQKYLGPEDRLKDLNFHGYLSKFKENVSIQTFDFGISAALSQIAEGIGLIKIIDDNTDKFREQGLSVGEYITIAAINRCVAPCSKSKLSKWFKRDWISSQFDIDPKILNAQTYWNHFQYLSMEKLDDIELAINKVVIKKFNLDLDSLFYDPTNFFTFSKGNGKEGLLQFGHSKENRNGKRIVSYSLLCARESGVPLMHHTYPGNVQDANKFKEMPEMIIQRLKKLDRTPDSVTLVFDKGNHSPEAFKAIDQSGFGFIVSARNSTQKELLHIPPEKFTKTILPASNKTIEYYKTSERIYGTERDVYVVLDSKKKKKHIALFNEKLKEKISDINEYFNSRLNVKKWRDKEAVEKKIESMIGRNPFKSIINFKISGSYGKVTFKLDTNEIEKENHMETLGKSILFTNRLDWPPESIIWGYREQYIVEHAFRKMKSPTSIAIRPMYHYSDSCIRAHVFVCVIALLLLSLLRLKLTRKSVPISYEELLDELSSVHALMIKTSPKAVPLWKLDSVNGLALKLTKKLKLMSLLKA